MSDNSASKMADNWQINKRLAESNMYMFEHGILCDVTFLVGEDRHEVKAHKYMLVSRSPVFYAMFCGTIAESRDKIEIPDIEVESFKQLLRFLYSEDCEVTAHTVMPLLYAGKKYDIGTLVENCKKYLESEMSAENVCVILQQAYVYDEQNLVQKCLSFVFKNGDQMLKSASIASLTKDVLYLIIESDLLQAEEVNVYNACVKWAEEECRRTRKEVNESNKREALGVDLIKQIRFPCMLLDDFINNVADDGILSAEEKVDAFLKLTDKKVGRESLFKDKARFIEKTRVNVIRLPQAFREVWTSDGGTDAIDFECSKSVFLTGVSLFTPHCEGEVCCNLEIVENDGTCLQYLNIKLLYDVNTPFIDTIFDSPVRIQKDTRYTLIQTVLGGTIYGKGGLNCVKEQGIEIRFFQSAKTKLGTCVEWGQFHGLIFDV